MKIEGIEPAQTGKNYCVYNPVRIKVTPALAECKSLEIEFKDNSQTRTAQFFPLNNQFEIELNDWLRLFFSSFENLKLYNDKSPQQPNTNLKTITLMFTEKYGEEGKEQQQQTELSLNILNGYNPAGTNYYHKAVKANALPRRFWYGYPFSLLTDYLTNQYTQHYVTAGSNSGYYKYSDDVHPIQKTQPKNCQGVYVRWLAPDTNYNYWLFPYAEEKGNAKETGSKERWFLDETQETSNEDTFGLTLTRELTLTDKVPKQYWNLLNTLFASPEVYILKKPPHEEQYLPADWEKVRIKGQNYQNKSYENAQTYTLTFLYKQQYTQTI